jgi:hypothetical protein
MIIGIFLICLAAFIVVLMSINWLTGFLASATTTDSVTFVAIVSGGLAIVILARAGLGGIAIAVAILIFWSLLIFGVDYVTVTATIDVSALLLCAAAVAVLAQSFLRGVIGK